MKVLLDNNLSWRIAAALAVLVAPDGDVVTHLQDKFHSSAVPDVEWIGALGREGGWTVISGDLRIGRRRHEREAWRRAHLKGFFLAPGWGRLTNLDKAALLLRWWPKLVQQEALVAPGALFEVPLRPGGRLRQLRT